MRPLPRREFESLVGDALDRIPEPLAELIDNVVVVVEDRHPVEPDLLGLYEGVPLTEREAYGGLVMPDRITIYRLAVCEGCADAEEVVDEVAVTVVHELAHHFGIDDDRLDELGWA
jgi:predicted Zn-dependent protease with MMP-like domain